MRAPPLASTYDPALRVLNLRLRPLSPGRSLWLDLNFDDFAGNSTGERVALAAHSIGADYLSPAALETGSPADPAVKGFAGFATAEMVDKAHELGLRVAVWTVNGLNLLEHLVEELGVDGECPVQSTPFCSMLIHLCRAGIITDYSAHFRKWAVQQGKPLPPVGDANRVDQCLAKHHKTVSA